LLAFSSTLSYLQISKGEIAKAETEDSTKLIYFKFSLSKDELPETKFSGVTLFMSPVQKVDQSLIELLAFAEKEKRRVKL